MSWASVMRCVLDRANVNAYGHNGQGLAACMEKPESWSNCLRSKGTLEASLSGGARQ